MRYPNFAHAHLAVGRGRSYRSYIVRARTYVRTYTISIDINKVGARSRSPQLVQCLALWGERERSRRQYRSQVSVFKPALFTEHSNTDKMKKRRTVADFVANIGESGDRDRYLGTSVAYLGAAPLATLQMPEKRAPPSL